MTSQAQINLLVDSDTRTLLKDAMQAAKNITAINRVSEKCFRSCVDVVDSPNLTPQQTRCISLCVDRFIEACSVLSEHLDKYIS